LFRPDLTNQAASSFGSLLTAYRSLSRLPNTDAGIFFHLPPFFKFQTEKNPLADDTARPPSVSPCRSLRWYSWCLRHRRNQFALLVFSAAAKHLKHRDEWIGWSEEQRRRRLRRSKQNRFHHQFSSELLSPCDMVMDQARRHAGTIEH
jgi:hypothetical protein